MRAKIQNLQIQKRQGVIKDKGLAKSTYRVNKQKVRLGKDPKLMREIVEDYDVCDFIFYWEYPSKDNQ